jgi:DNA-binding transcriptional regulator GbsR (MarR family)
MSLTAQQNVQVFLDLWGDMAAQWGISRSMAQVYALLYVSPVALDTEEIMEHLQISRGNANINIRKLIDWGLVYKEERPETRRDFFWAEKDVWAMTARIIEERHRREIQPVVAALEQIIREGSSTDDNSVQGMRDFMAQLRQMAALLHLVDDVLDAIMPLVKARKSQEIQQLISFLEHLDHHTD